MKAAAHHVELLLKLLVSVVNTELLKAVDLKCLEPGVKHRISKTFTQLDDTDGQAY